MTSEDQINDNLIPEKVGFLVKVVKLENIKPPKKFTLKVDFNGINLGSSQIFSTDKPEIDVEWETLYEPTDSAENIIYDLISHPLVFSVLHEEVSPLPTISSKKKDQGKTKGAGKNTPGSKSSSLRRSTQKESSETSKKVKRPSSKSSVASTVVEAADTMSFFVGLGAANLDLLPLLRGPNEIKETLLLHPNSELKGSEAIAWPNLPRIRVEVTGLGETTRKLSELVTSGNVVYVTVESLFNITPDFNGEVQAATVLHRNQQLEVVKFTGGVAELDHFSETPKRKKWHGLSDMTGQAALSLYKVSDGGGVGQLGSQTPLLPLHPCKVTSEVLATAPRAHWYQMYRGHLSADSQVALKSKLVSYRCWPVEVIVTANKSGPNLQAKNKKGAKGIGDGIRSSIDGKHYVAFLDLTRLLYTGVTSARVAAQLYLYQKGLMERLFGSEHDMFELSGSLRGSGLTADKVPKSPSSKKDQSRTTTPKSGKKEKTPVIVEDSEENPPPPPEPEPVFNDNGEPIFLVAQFEFLKPLIEKRSAKELVESVSSIIPLRPLLTKEQTARIDAIQAYDDCIERVMHAVHEEYQLFYTANEDTSRPMSTKNFLMHLHITGAYTRMKESVKECAEEYVKETVGLPQQVDVRNTDHQQLLTSTYLNLVNRMCKTVSSLGPLRVSEYNNPLVSCETLLFFSEEAIEEDKYDRAQQYLLERLDKSKSAVPTFWIDYARFLVKKQEYEKAGECAREAISLDVKCTEALFFHGLLSWLTEDFGTAEQLLLAAVSFDPHCLEAWVALYIFHKQMDDQMHAQTELEFAKQCIRERKSENNRFPSMSWVPTLAGSDRIFLLAAVRLIHFSFPELAELALSYDLLIHGRTMEYLYYLAVCHYLQGRFSHCLDHLEEAKKIGISSFENGYLWEVEGHANYKLKDNSAAKQAFECSLNFAVQSEDQDRDRHRHLMELRLANILATECHLYAAHQRYLSVCGRSPSPLSWLGLGITCFLQYELDYAELALSEANLLDCRVATVWAYLAIVNILMARPPQVYQQCMAQAVRYSPDDPEVADKLSVLIGLVGPVDI